MFEPRMIETRGKLVFRYAERRENAENGAQSYHRNVHTRHMGLVKPNIHPASRFP